MTAENQSNNNMMFLKELQRSMNTQETDVQAHPRFWVIQDVRTVPTDEDFCDDVRILDTEEGILKTFNEYLEDEQEDGSLDHDQLEDLKAIVEDEDVEELNTWFEDNNINDYEAVYTREEAYNVMNTMFLLKEDAKNHLKNNQHHYTNKAHTFAMTAQRSPAVERLLNIIMSEDWDSYITDQ